MPVDVVHWNPRARLGTTTPLKKIRRRRRVNNFGDLLGPIIVAELVRRRGLIERPERSRLLAVGSIMRLARDGDVIWGIGVNGKSLGTPLPFTTVDVRAVRGPLTRDVLLSHGVDVAAVFGDPGLLVGELWSRDELAAGGTTHEVTIVPNLHDYEKLAADPRVVDPTSPIMEVLSTIARSQLVVGSSLHGIVVAEALGVPARLISSRTEPMFKYEDYFRGTGRDAPEPADNVEGAIERGGAPGPVWDSRALLDAFPSDLWTQPHER